jgi:hypothetical protein
VRGSLQDLVFTMTNAIDTRSANRLAGIYHWPGTSADSGYRIWTRLEAIAQRPLVDIVPVMAGSRPPPDPRREHGRGDHQQRRPPLPPAPRSIPTCIRKRACAAIPWPCAWSRPSATAPRQRARCSV